MALPKIYRNFAFLFLLIAVILAGGIFYLTFGRTEVIIQPAYQKVSANILFDVKELPFDSPVGNRETVQGKIIAYDYEERAFYLASGSQALVEDGTVGEVEIINNYGKDQTLVATTRLLTPDGTILRIKDKITIPAGGKIKAQVYPDKPAEFKELAPTKFTIPGLWAGLQDKIFGQNTQTLKGGGRMAKAITENDLTEAEKDFSQKLTDRATADFSAKLSKEEELYSRLIQKEVLDKQFNGAVGDVKDEFEIFLKMRIVIIAFDEASLLDKIKTQLTNRLSSDKKIDKVDKDTLNYTVEKYDVDAKTANIKVYAEGLSIIKGEGAVLDKKALVGLSEAQIKEYFSKYPEIESVEVKFYPNWFKNASLSPSRIRFIIK